MISYRLHPGAKCTGQLYTNLEYIALRKVQYFLDSGYQDDVVNGRGCFMNFIFNPSRFLCSYRKP